MSYICDMNAQKPLSVWQRFKRNRIVEITPKGIIDRMMNFDDYLKDEQVKALRKEYYAGTDKKIRF